MVHPAEPLEFREAGAESCPTSQRRQRSSVESIPNPCAHVHVPKSERISPHEHDPFCCGRLLSAV
eukprot:3708127-Prymnesium_polylepis.1